MIPKAYITQWRNNAPWQEDFQVEQDLVIERALVAIFSDEYLRERLAFRGGTALYKMYLTPAARYSEDIDLVQTRAEAFGPIIDKLREVLSFLGDDPKRKQKQHNNTLIYRFDSEEGIPLRLKIEVNCREHRSIFGIKVLQHAVNSAWINSVVNIASYELAEILGTKLRALYQRKKGRDLFDLYYAIKNTTVDPDKIIEAWQFYMYHEGNTISKNEMLANMDKKLMDQAFLFDMKGLLRPGITYDVSEAYELVRKELLERI